MSEREVQQIERDTCIDGRDESVARGHSNRTDFLGDRDRSTGHWNWTPHGGERRGNGGGCLAMVHECQRWREEGARAWQWAPLPGAAHAIICNTRCCNDFKKLSPVYQSFKCEVFHSLVITFAPKSTAFTFHGILIRSVHWYSDYVTRTAITYFKLFIQEQWL